MRIMAGTVFLAGASGAIGRRLSPLLLDAGYVVYGTTRSEVRAAELERAGVRPIVVDAYDAEALRACMASARPEIVINQLTNLPHDLTPESLAASLAENARVRIEGTKNLIDAARYCGARRFIAQSIAWAFEPGPEPHGDDDAIDVRAQPSVATLERLTLESPPLEGVVLRYGYFYGPGTWFDKPNGNINVHVDAAASATLRAIGGAPGAYNIAEPSAYASSEKAEMILGWTAMFRLS